MTLTAGATLQNGRYSIQSIWVDTAIDLTYQARHTYLEQPVHLKSVPESLWKEIMTADDRQGFHQRSTFFAQSTNPHLVRIIDGFEENGVPFLVFKPVTGQSLAAWLQTGHRLSVSEAIALLQPLVDTVASLHQSGIIHGALGGNSLAIRDDRQMLVVADIALHSFWPRGAIANVPELTFPQDIQGLAATAFALLTGHFIPTETLIASAQAGTLRDDFHPLSETVEKAIVKGLLAQPQQQVSDWFQHLQHVSQFGAVTIDGADGNSADENGAYGNRADRNGAYEKGDQGTHPGNSQNKTHDPVSSVPTECITSSLIHEELMPLPPTSPPLAEAPTVSSPTPAPSTLVPRTLAPSTAQNQPQHRSSSAERPRRPKSRSRWQIPVALSLCSVVAASVGGYLGFSFRLQEPEQLDHSPIFGREFFGTEQTFPVSDQWPGTSSAEFDEDDFLFEQRTPRSPYASPNDLDNELVFPEVESEVDPLPSAYDLLQDAAIGSDRETPHDRDADSSIQEGVEPPSDGTSPMIESPPPAMTPAPSPSPLPPVLIPDGVEPPSPNPPPPPADVQSDSVETSSFAGDRLSNSMEQHAIGSEAG